MAGSVPQRAPLALHSDGIATPSPIPANLEEIFAESYAAGVATRDARLVPECAMAWGIVPRLAERVLRIFIPRAHVGRMRENLEDNGQIAVSIVRMSDLRTYQLKGFARSFADARPEERGLLDGYSQGFAGAADYEGTGDVIRRVAYWPCLAVEMEIVEVFAQTPGPGTGKRIDA